MSNVNLTVVFLSLGGCCLYVWSMSALGRWLAACREGSSMAPIATSAGPSGAELYFAR